MDSEISSESDSDEYQPDLLLEDQPGPIPHSGLQSGQVSPYLVQNQPLPSTGVPDNSEEPIEDIIGTSRAGRNLRLPNRLGYQPKDRPKTSPSKSERKSKQMAAKYGREKQ